MVQRQLNSEEEAVLKKQAEVAAARRRSSLHASVDPTPAELHRPSAQRLSVLERWERLTRQLLPSRDGQYATVSFNTADYPSRRPTAKQATSARPSSHSRRSR